MTHEIKCPHCGETFKVDENNYAVIVSQIRSQEFNKEVQEKLDQAKLQYSTELKLSEKTLKSEFQKELAEKDKKNLQDILINYFC